MVVKFQTDYAGIRISVAAFNTESEIEQLLAVLGRLLPARLLPAKLLPAGR